MNTCKWKENIKIFNWIKKCVVLPKWLCVILFNTKIFSVIFLNSIELQLKLKSSYSIKGFDRVLLHNKIKCIESFLYFQTHWLLCCIYLLFLSTSRSMSFDAKQSSQHQPLDLFYHVSTLFYCLCLIFPFFYFCSLSWCWHPFSSFPYPRAMQIVNLHN